jgi:hypothetical protein
MKSKIMASLAVLLIALTVSGFAYAHWTDMITINGTAQMGELIFGFTHIWECDDGKMVWFNSVTDFYNDYPEPKDVGSISCVLSEPQTAVHIANPETVYKTMTITITHAYPEYVCWCFFSLDNGGSIPLDVVMYCVNGKDTYLTYLWYDTNLDGTLDCIIGKNATGDPVVYIWFFPLSNGGPWFGQIDQGGSVSQGVAIYFTEAALECHTYEFQLLIHASQWN